MDRSLSSGDAFDAVVAEAKQELGYGQEEAEQAESEVTAEATEPSVGTAEGAEAQGEEKEAVTEGEEREAAAEDTASAPPEEKSEEETTAGVAEETSEEKEVSDALHILTNPELLEAALRQAGVETIQELPLIKDLLGRVEQSTRDRVLAEIARAEYERNNIEAVIERGRKAADEVIALLDQAAKELEEGAEEVRLPDRELLRQKFDEYASGAVQAYHNKHFGEIAERLFRYPEIQVSDEEQQQALQSAAAREPSEWLETVYTIARENLWRMAQQDVLERATAMIDDQKKLLEASHQEEIKKLNERHERELKKAIEKAKEEARAEAFAQLAEKAPPKETPRDIRSSGTEEEEDYGETIEEIWQNVKRSMERSSV